MDRGAWWAAVHMVAWSRIQLKLLSMHALREVRYLQEVRLSRTCFPVHFAVLCPADGFLVLQHQCSLFFPVFLIFFVDCFPSI